MIQPQQLVQTQTGTLVFVVVNDATSQVNAGPALQCKVNEFISGCCFRLAQLHFWSLSLLAILGSI